MDRVIISQKTRVIFTLFVTTYFSAVTYFSEVSHLYLKLKISNLFFDLDHAFLFWDAWVNEYNLFFPSNLGPSPASAFV